MISNKMAFRLKSNWDLKKAKLKARFPKLTEVDLDFDETQMKEMLAKLEFKLAIPSNELQLSIETL